MVLARQSLGSLAALVFGVLASVVLTRALGAEARGEYALAVKVAGLVLAVAQWGIPETLLQLLGEKRQLDALVGSSLVLGLLGAAVSGGVLALGLPLLENNLLRGVDPPLLWLSLAGALFSLAGLLARRFILLRGQVGLYNAMDAGRTAMFLLLALGVALLLPRQALGGVGAWFIGEAVLAVVALAYLWRRLSARWRVSRRLMRELVAAGAPIQLGLVAIYLGGEGGAFILNARLDLAAVGVYAVTLGVARLVLQVSTALRTALQSRLVGPESDAAATTLLVTRHGLLWMLLASAALALAAPLMPLVFGREFAGSEPILLLMLPGMVAYGLMQLLAGHLLRLGRRGILAVSSLTFAVASIGLQLLGTQLLGLAGAAIGLSLAYLLSAGVVLLAFVRLSGRDARELLPGNHDVRVYPALARRLISL